MPECEILLFRAEARRCVSAKFLELIAERMRVALSVFQGAHQPVCRSQSTRPAWRLARPLPCFRTCQAGYIPNRCISYIYRILGPGQTSETRSPGG